MYFCDKCGGLLKPNADGKMACVSCSEITSGEPMLKDKKKKEKEGVAIEDEKTIEAVEEAIEALPETKIECPKCGYDTAYYWEVQTRASDEPQTTFYKCKKCKHTWRQY